MGSGDYVFTKLPDGKLEFKGDFEGLYQSDPDPWGQSGKHPRMKEYYAFSRHRLLVCLNDLPWKSLMEVGCGYGHVTDLIDRTFYPKRMVHGCDISKAVLIHAFKKYPNGTWILLDIANPCSIKNRVYDVVILSQILWYVLDNLPMTFKNVMKLIKPNGHLIIQTAFLDHQEYGREIVDGFNGLLRYVLDHHAADFQVVSAGYDNSSRYAPHHDGLLVLQATR